jgi:hypothetical protein
MKIKFAGYRWRMSWILQVAPRGNSSGGRAGPRPGHRGTCGRGPAVAELVAITTAAGQSRVSGAQPAIRENYAKWVAARLLGDPARPFGWAPLGALVGAGRGAQILLGGVGRGAQVCAPVRPCPPCRRAHTGPDWRGRAAPVTGPSLPPAGRPARPDAAGMADSARPFPLRAHAPRHVMTLRSTRCLSRSLVLSLSVPPSVPFSVPPPSTNYTCM